MKAITFRGYTQADKKSAYTLRRKYCFWLPGRWFYFGSERTCEGFMSACSEFFSTQFYVLNKIYGEEIFSQWRSIWMYSLDYQTEKQITAQFNDLEMHLNKVSTHGKNAERAEWPYSNLIKACDNMIELCTLFKTVHDQRSSTTLKKDTMLLKDRIEKIKKEMETYMGPDAEHLKPDTIKLTAEQAELMPPDLSVSLP